MAIKKRHRELNRKCNQCNRSIDDRSKSGLCKICCQRGKLNGFYGRKHNKETRNKMIEGAKNRDNSTYHKIVLTKKQRKEHSVRMKQFHKDGKYIEAVEKWIESSIKTKKNTKIERIVNSVLIENGLIENIDYKRNFQISKYNVDFLLGNKIVIECYGDYWHKNPKYYNDEDRWSRDNLKKEFLEKQGYVFIILWEDEIINNLERVKKELLIYVYV